ncbi:helix-turn-helix domain-containing protein [Salmonella enterica]|nr:helix-turn-helix domain-containing protein [Salmonella enterica]
MDIQSAIGECDIARAILIAMGSYKKTPSPNESILQSLTFAIESSLDRAKNAFSHKKIDTSQSYFTPCGAEPPAPPTYAPCNIGYRIQIARENLGMSEDDLAEKLDIHPGNVLAWESGHDQSLAGMIIPLANELKCDPMWLLTGESTNHQSPATPAHQLWCHHSGQQRSGVSDHTSHHAKLQSQA